MITKNTRKTTDKLLDIFPLPYLEDAPLPIIAFKPDTSIIFVNKMFGKVSGYSSAELIGRKIPYPWWKQEALEESEKDFYKTMDGSADLGKVTEHIFRTKQGGLIYVITVTVAIMRDGKVYYYSTHWNDITAQKKAEETLKQARKELELRVQERTSKLMSLNTKLSRQIRRRRKVEGELIKSREQLRAFSTYLQSIREDERTAIAREIHDELGQSLTALKLQSAWIQMHLPSGHEDLQNKIQMVLEIIDSTIDTVKHLSSKLRPSSLDDLGITAAIEWQAKRFEDETGITCDIHSNLDEIGLKDVQNTGIFRIFQEALTNIARHAIATKVKVSLAKKNDKIIMVIEDDGVGISSKQIYNRKSLGILGMRERANYLEGNLIIKNRKGHGTVVILTIPLYLEEEKQ
jgi:PAS domain S-box-containing protein